MEDHGTKRDPRTHDIIGAAMAVHRELGPGFLEAIYQEALGIEFQLRNIPAAREVGFALQYRGRPIGGTRRADFVCYGDIVVELKALPSIGAPEAAQVVHYPKASGNRLGLLLNFGARSLEFRRVIYHPGWTVSEESEQSEFRPDPPQA